jgi:butyrate kinase
MVDDHGARIAVLETQHKFHQATLTDVTEQLEKLNASVTQINSKLDKNMGFIAGAAFAFSAIGAVIGMTSAAIFKRLVE